MRLSTFHRLFLERSHLHLKTFEMFSRVNLVERRREILDNKTAVHTASNALLNLSPQSSYARWAGFQRFTDRTYVDLNCESAYAIAMEKWVVLQTFDSEAEARVVLSKLESKGIATQLLGSQSKAAGLVPNMLRLMVLQKDLEKAKSILTGAKYLNALR